MALDTYAELWHKVLLRCPAASVGLAQDWVNNALRQVAERRHWSWLMGKSQFLIPAVYNTGTVSVTRSNRTVTGLGTTFTADMVGRQFRIGLSNPIYTIQTFNNATSVDLDEEWGGSTATGQSYEIYLAYVTPATDFFAFYSVWDPKYNWKLHFDVEQETLNTYDSQRANQGTSAYALSFHTYDSRSSPPLPRYEIWPHQKSQYVYPYLYTKRITDLEDGGTLPRYVRGDVLLDMALIEAAEWKSEGNAYFDLRLAESKRARVERSIMEMEKQDDEIWEQSIRYEGYDWGWAPLPWWDADWMQSHDVAAWW